MQSEADTQPCNGCEIAYPGQMVLTAHAKVSARLNHCENAQKKSFDANVSYANYVSDMMMN